MELTSYIDFFDLSVIRLEPLPPADSPANPALRNIEPEPILSKSNQMGEIQMTH